jgi:hypothetical protein
MEGVGTNRYAYADNDPVNKSDPNGHTTAMGDVDGSESQERDAEVDIADNAGQDPIGNAVADGFDVGLEYTKKGLDFVDGFSEGLQATGTVLAPAGVLAGKFAKTGRMAAEAIQTYLAETRGTKGVVGAIATKDGQVFTGRSKRAGGPTIDGVGINSGTKSAYDAIPEGKRSSYHGKCCEVEAMSKAMDAGANLKGAVSIAVDVKTGLVKGPCPSCARTTSRLGIYGVPEGP